MRGLFLLSSHVFSSQLLMSGSEEPSDRLDVARTDGSLSGANKTKKHGPRVGICDAVLIRTASPTLKE